MIEEIEKTREIFGAQIWDYSIEGSRQKLSRRPMKVEELFAPNINPGLETYLRATGED